jgi:thioredoxin 1
MKKTAAMVLVTVSLFAIGGAIIAWSMYKKHGSGQQLSHVKEFTDENFQQDVVEASKKQPVLVDFYTDWCFPCKMMDPVLEEVAKDLIGKAVIGKLNTDKNLIARRFGISRIPAMFIIKDGEVKDSYYGVVPKAALVKALTDFGA